MRYTCTICGRRGNRGFFFDASWGMRCTAFLACSKRCDNLRQVSMALPKKLEDKL